MSEQETAVTLPRDEWDAFKQRLTSIESMMHVIVDADAIYRGQVTALVDALRDAQRSFYLPPAVREAMEPLLPTDREES